MTCQDGLVLKRGHTFALCQTDLLMGSLALGASICAAVVQHSVCCLSLFSTIFFVFTGLLITAQHEVHIMNVCFFALSRPHENWSTTCFMYLWDIYVNQRVTTCILAFSGTMHLKRTVEVTLIGRTSAALYCPVFVFKSSQRSNFYGNQL